jgi:hypothetical protein
MRFPSAVASVSLLFAMTLSCSKEPRPDASSPAKPRGITLPSLDGIGMTRIGPVCDDVPGAAKWLRKTTVIIQAEGESVVAGTALASTWRGFAEQPFDGSYPMSVAESRLRMRYVRIAVAADGTISISKIKCGSLSTFRETIERLKAEHAFDKAGLVASRDALYAKVLRAMAVLVELQVRFSLYLSDPREDTLPPKLYAHLKEQEGAATRNSGNLPDVALRIRADGRASFGAVEDAILTSMRRYHWRVSFVGLLNGEEVEIGDPWTSPDEPPVTHDPIGVEVTIEESTGP